MTLLTHVVLLGCLGDSSRARGAGKVTSRGACWVAWVTIYFSAGGQVRLPYYSVLVGW